jgi:hypothetical protein
MGILALLLLLLLQVSIVKDYVARQLQMEGKEIAKDRDTISRLQVRSTLLLWLLCSAGCSTMPFSADGMWHMQEQELHRLMGHASCIVQILLQHWKNVSRASKFQGTQRPRC